RSELQVRGALHVKEYGASGREQAILRALDAAEVEVVVVSAEELRSVADTEQPQGIVAIARVPRSTLGNLPAGSSEQRWLVLDGVQDPGNLGTILRTAAAFGVGGVLSLPGTVDAWNAKVVRSTMGASFRIPVVPVDPNELHDFLVAREVVLWATDSAGEDIGAV